MQRLSATDSRPEVVVPVCCATYVMREQSPKVWWRQCSTANFHLSSPTAPGLRREADVKHLGNPPTLARRCRLWQKLTSLVSSAKDFAPGGR